MATSDLHRWCGDRLHFGVWISRLWTDMLPELTFPFLATTRGESPESDLDFYCCKSNREEPNSSKVQKWVENFWKSCGVNRLFVAKTLGWKENLYELQCESFCARVALILMCWWRKCTSPNYNSIQAWNVGAAPWHFSRGCWWPWMHS